MTSTAWAYRIRCDWPGCLAITNVMPAPSEAYPLDTEVPGGWLVLATGLHLATDRFGTLLGHLCPQHSHQTMTATVGAFKAAEIKARPTA
jgi:hypothetical protein